MSLLGMGESLCALALGRARLAAPARPSTQRRRCFLLLFAVLVGGPLVGLALSVVIWVLLERSVWGRWLLASGQNLRAARLAGIPVEAVRAATYLAVTVFAAIAGYLLASFSGQAPPPMNIVSKLFPGISGNFEDASCHLLLYFIEFSAYLLLGWPP